MLRWWHDTLRIGFAPGEVCLERIGHGFPRVPPVRERFGCAAGDRAGWDASLDVLQAALASSAWHNARARVVLSNHFVRYALIPWSGDVAGSREVESLALAHLRRVHGEPADGWTVRVSRSRYGCAWLAAAVDSALLARLQALCEPARLKPVGIEPLFAAAFDRWRGAVREARAWFAVLDAGLACLARLDGGAWSHLYSLRPAGAPGDELAAVLDRWALLEGGDDEGDGEPVYLYAPGQSPDWQPILGARRHPLKVLGGDASAAEAGYALLEAMA